MGCCFIMYDDMNHCLNIIPSESRPFFQYYPYVTPSVWCIFRLCACLCNEMKKLFKILSPLKLCNQPRKNLKMILSLLKNEHFKKSPQKLIIYSFPLIPSVSASVTLLVLKIADCISYSEEQNWFEFIPTANIWNVGRETAASKGR